MGTFLYGETVEFEIPTGTVYTDVLAVDKDCVYQKEPDGPYFIRRVSDDGRVIEEVEVETGISNKEMITITGVEEGWYADPGYAKLINAEMDEEQ